MEVEGFGELSMILEGRTVFLCTEYKALTDRITLHIDTQEDALYLKDNTVFCLRVAHIRHNQDWQTEHTLVLRFDHGLNKYKRMGIISRHLTFGVDEDPSAQGGEERTVEIV